MTARKAYAPRCRGVIGFLFGHKWQGWDLSWSSNYCKRCGMAQGTAREVKP